MEYLNRVRQLLVLFFFLIFASDSSSQSSDSCISVYGASANTPTEFDTLRIGFGLKNNCGESVTVENVAVSFHDYSSPETFVQTCYQPAPNLLISLSDNETKLLTGRPCNLSENDLGADSYKLRYKVMLDGVWHENLYERDVEILPKLNSAPETDILSFVPSIVSAFKNPSPLLRPTEFYPPFGGGEWRLSRTYSYQSHTCFGNFYNPLSPNGNPACDTYALDFAPNPNTNDANELEVRAVADGDIVIARFQGNFGNTVLLAHGGNVLSRYAHLQKISVTSGRVRKGQKIGVAGNTGNSFGRHLHFAMYMLNSNGGADPSVTAMIPEPLGGVTGFMVQTSPLSRKVKFENIDNKLICIENCEDIFPIEIHDNLMWDINQSITGNWFSSENHCSNSTRFNYSDWRLPTKFELKRAVFCSNGKPTPLADREACPGFGFDVSVDIPAVVESLSLSPQRPYWSGTRVAADAFFAVDFSDGRGSFFSNSNSFEAICVRDK